MNSSPRPGETVVNDVLRGQIDELQLVAARSNNRLSLVDQGELRVRAPANVVEIVLGNLIRNALTYTNDGEVEVTVDSSGVQVADSGIGMSSQELEHAFEPFYRAESSRGATKGHGLGLSIVRRLCHKFDWTVSARNRSDKGMVFEISFC